MAYVKYTGLNNPNEVLEKMAEYVTSRGYTIVEKIKDVIPNDIYLVDNEL